MSDDDLLANFPSDDVPSVLNIQDVYVEDAPAEFIAEGFQDWLYEGRHHCEVAECLLHTWTHHLQLSDHDCIMTFCSRLAVRSC